MSLKYEPQASTFEASANHKSNHKSHPSTLGVLSHAKNQLSAVGCSPKSEERELFIDNLLVRNHFIIVMIRWTGLAPWEFEFPFTGSLTSTFLVRTLPNPQPKPRQAASERRGINLQGFKDFYLQAEARIWP